MVHREAVKLGMSASLYRYHAPDDPVKHGAPSPSMKNKFHFVLEWQEAMGRMGAVWIQTTSRTKRMTPTQLVLESAGQLRHALDTLLSSQIITMDTIRKARESAARANSMLLQAELELKKDAVFEVPGNLPK